MTTPTREIHLASRPTGWPTPENFRTVEVELARQDERRARRRLRQRTA